MWLDLFKAVMATGLAFFAITMVLLAIKILQIPNQEWEEKRRRIRNQREFAKKWNEMFK